MQLRWPSDLSLFHEKVAHNKKSNLERHFTTKHTQFASKYVACWERKKAVEELQKQQSSSILSNGTQFSNEFADRFEQFKINKITLAFIVNPLNTNSNEIHIEPFGIDTGSLEMQMIDLKSKALCSGKFTELKSMSEELEVQKCMYEMQQKLTALKERPRTEALNSTHGIVFQIATVRRRSWHLEC
ncbi:uncharacterized protein TNCV_1091321 [Trichonephila clavipes]|nr:uncharacterized protein TNCV_1091321 [Trichonephila clavipes]